jgi:hypothetical protein
MTTRSVKAAEAVVVRAADRMVDKRGFMLPDQLGIRGEHKLYCERRNALEKAIANYRCARLAALREKKARAP